GGRRLAGCRAAFGSGTLKSTVRPYKIGLKRRSPEHLTAMEQTSTDTTGLNLSDSALRRVARLKAEKGSDQLLLRVFVQGGGCSGFPYGFKFETERDEDDVLIERGDVSVVVDPLSYQYLAGAEIDFLDDLLGSRFVINNPNATTTCGCGSSFAI